MQKTLQTHKPRICGSKNSSKCYLPPPSFIADYKVNDLLLKFYFTVQSLSCIFRGLSCAKPHHLFEPNLLWWQYVWSRPCLSACDSAIWEIGQPSLRSSAGWHRKLHEYLLNKSCEFIGLRQDSSLWFLAPALWFLLGIAECRPFFSNWDGFKEQPHNGAFVLGSAT